jgi:enoyl-[acyl-carrier-protein] reductase (NADH)
MAVAKARLLSNQSTRSMAKDAGASQVRVVQANVVLQLAPELADGVMAGTEPLNEA